MPDADQIRETPLSRELRAATPRKRVVPRDAFELALMKWEAGERIDIGALARELGVGRATVFRWVGSRELLLGEVIWSVFDATWRYVQKAAKGKGADYAADASYLLMELLLQSDALRQFIAQDAEYALRLLAAKGSTVQTRCVQAVADTLRSKAESDGLSYAIETDSLAFIIVRIVEACIYSDQITGRQPDIRTASEAVRILVAARAPVQRKPARKAAARKRGSRGAA